MAIQANHRLEEHPPTITVGMKRSRAIPPKSRVLKSLSSSSPKHHQSPMAMAIFYGTSLVLPLKSGHIICENTTHCKQPAKEGNYSTDLSAGTNNQIGSLGRVANSHYREDLRCLF